MSGTHWPTPGGAAGHRGRLAGQTGSNCEIITVIEGDCVKRGCWSFLSLRCQYHRGFGERKLTSSLRPFSHTLWLAVGSKQPSKTFKWWWHLQTQEKRRAERRNHWTFLTGRTQDLLHLVPELCLKLSKFNSISPRV